MRRLILATCAVWLAIAAYLAWTRDDTETLGAIIGAVLFALAGRIAERINV